MRIGRFACNNEPRGNAGYSAIKTTDKRNGGILFMANSKQQLEMLIILLEEASEVLFKALIKARERFENADSCGRTEFAMFRYVAHASTLPQSPGCSRPSSLPAQLGLQW